MANEKVGFFKNHADAIAIIGVNLGIAALILNLTLSNISSINATNARIDTMYAMFYDLLKETKK